MRREVTMLFCIIFMLMILSPHNPAGLFLAEYTKQSVTQPMPICDVRLFFSPEFNTTGNVAYAKDISIAGFHILEMMYYNASYGAVIVKGLLQTITYERVLSIHAYGFKGEINWDGTVEDTGVHADGTAYLLMIAHQ